MSIPEYEERTKQPELNAPESGAAPESESGADPESPRSLRIPRTRISRMWVRTLPALLTLIVVLILVAQNRTEVTVRFFNASLKLPLSVALLGAMVLGALVVLTLGSARVVQLRRRVHLQNRSKRRGSQSTTPEPESSKEITTDHAGDDSAPPEGD